MYCFFKTGFRDTPFYGHSPIIPIGPNTSFEDLVYYSSGKVEFNLQPE